MSLRSWFTLELPPHALVSKLSDEERRLQAAMAADLEVQTALAKIELQKQKNELAAIEEEKKQSAVLRNVFTAFKKFRRGEQSGYTLISTWGESATGTRGRISAKITGPDGGVKMYSDETWTFFTAQRLYTNVIQPWMHGTVSTDQVRQTKFDTAAKNAEWIEFPLKGLVK